MLRFDLLPLLLLAMLFPRTADTEPISPQKYCDRVKYTPQIFRRGQMAIGRRSSVPQLECTNCGSFTLEYAECKCLGMQGNDPQWQCDGHGFPAGQSFKNTEFNCESYPNPGDPDYWDGSCGLKYSVKGGWGDWNQVFLLLAVLFLLGGCICFCVVGAVFINNAQPPRRPIYSGRSMYRSGYHY